jgi:hypothetical protein
MISAVRKPKPESPYDIMRWYVPDIEISIPNIWRLNGWVEMLEAPIPEKELAGLERAFDMRLTWARRQRENRARYSQAMLSTLERGLILIQRQRDTTASVAA